MQTLPIIQTIECLTTDKYYVNEQWIKTEWDTRLFTWSIEALSGPVWLFKY